MQEYARTLQALEQYRAWAAEDDGGVLPDTAQPVKPGDSYEGIPRLVRLLHLVGDLPAGADTSPPDIYEGELVSAVERFQNRHGLQPDGRIDRSTLAQLNVPLTARVHQLELALERWRRHLYDSSRPAIVLNLPEFRLRAFGSTNDLELEMKIIVGQAPDRQTPILTSRLDTIVIHPYWNVPQSIQRDELIPEIIKDHHFLRDNHLEIVGLQDGVVGGAIPDNVIESLRSRRFWLRQAPGPKNVLGMVKFAFPNDYGIYMHGTSAQWLFSHPQRDFSHGCIRVERAEELAEWVLRSQPDWSPSRIIRAIRGSRTVGVKLIHPIQLVTIYVTAIVLENGEVDFYDDIYGEDTAFDKRIHQTTPPLSSSR